MKTENALYICANTRYQGSKGDSDEFDLAIETLSKHSLSPFQSFGESSYLESYIVGMYPEFKGALDYYTNLARQEHNEGRHLSDELIGLKAKMTINKI